MKKLLFFIILLYACTFCFTQTKIGTVQYSNILEITKLNNNLLYTFVEEKEGLISVIQDFYCVINDKKFGPFTNQPYIEEVDNNYCVEVKKGNKKGYIIENCLYGFYEDLDIINFNSDGKSFCFIYSEHDECYLIENGEIIINKPYISDACYSPTGSLCYVYGDYIDEELASFIQINNETFGPYTDVGSFEFSENGNYYVKVEINEEDDFILFNGRLYSEDDFDFLFFTLNNPNIKIDSGGFYYSDGQHRTPSFDKILTKEIKYFSESSDTFVFTAIKDDLYYLIKNITEVYGPYPSISLNMTYLEPDSERLYYNVYNNGIFSLYREGEKLSESTRLIYPYFSKNGKICCYSTKVNDNSEYLIAGNEKIGPFKFLSAITVSDDGSKIAYTARISDSEYVFEGIKKHGPYKYIMNLAILSDNSLVFTYVDDDYKSYIYYNGKKYGPYKLVNNGYIQDFSICLDGKHVACYVEFYDLKSKYIFLNGDIIGEIPEGIPLTPVFSKDGKHVLCVNLNPNCLYLDGKKINGRNGGTESFTSFGIVSYIESDNNKDITHLIINGQDYIGKYVRNDFIYIDGDSIMLLKK